MKQGYKIAKMTQSCALFQNDYTTKKQLKLRGLTEMVGLIKLILYYYSIQYFFLSRAIMLEKVTILNLI